MSPAELLILKALHAAPNKTAAWRDLREASGCKTIVGFRRVMFRLMNAGQISRADQHGLDIVLTFGGLRALRVA